MYSVVRLAYMYSVVRLAYMYNVVRLAYMYNVVNCLPVHTELTSVVVDVGKGSGGGPETIVSSRWARDDDINRMIR